MSGWRKKDLNTASYGVEVVDIVMAFRHPSNLR
ncbi:hypothetical protein Asd1617_03376 [Shigella dysenteriae 1617]|uniref:Uncharacterized protein n=1 Tax=Shigella dysenteriae 1617 TaxID=754093 RepID=A0A0A6ZVQ1_SHIDY|nr:hypothetical protein Asd1617_03376 [Shigella dysenteriae 1617]